MLNAALTIFTMEGEFAPLECSLEGWIKVDGADCDATIATLNNALTQFLDGRGFSDCEVTTPTTTPTTSSTSTSVKTVEEESGVLFADADCTFLQDAHLKSKFHTDFAAAIEAACTAWSDQSFCAVPLSSIESVCNLEHRSLSTFFRARTSILTAVPDDPNGAESVDADAGAEVVQSGSGDDELGPEDNTRPQRVRRADASVPAAASVDAVVQRAVDRGGFKVVVRLALLYSWLEDQTLVAVAAYPGAASLDVVFVPPEDALDAVGSAVDLVHLAVMDALSGVPNAADLVLRGLQAAIVNGSAAIVHTYGSDVRCSVLFPL
jgi:hypothetical protein